MIRALARHFRKKGRLMPSRTFGPRTLVEEFMKDVRDPANWRTNYERGLELVRRADQITWDTHGRVDVSAIRARATEYFKNPTAKEPPF